MIVTHRRKGDITVLELEGNLQHQDEIMIFLQALDRVIDDKNFRILLNFRNMGFISSFGIGVLISRANRVRDLKGNLGVMNLNKEILELFNRIKISENITVFDNEEEAVRLL